MTARRQLVYVLLAGLTLNLVLWLAGVAVTLFVLAVVGCARAMFLAAGQENLERRYERESAAFNARIEARARRELSARDAGVRTTGGEE